MGMTGKLKPSDWGRMMPAHSPQSQKGPWFYRKTEMVMVQFETDAASVLHLLPSDLELLEPATAFMVMEQNHQTTLGPYGEVYLGIMCTWKGEPYAYVPGVYVTGENSQIVGREVYGFGKKRCSRFEIIKHDNGEVEAIMEVIPGDRALRAVMMPSVNAPADALGETPLICLKIVPDIYDTDIPALAQLTTVSFTAQPLIGSDGKAEMFVGPGHIIMGCPSDVKIPVGKVLACVYAHFNADLPYGKVLKTYTGDDFKT